MMGTSGEENIIEGSLKHRDGKKWKPRWAVLNKLSPVADVLQLQLYRDSREKARGSPTKASLSLPNSLALITGFTLDKECHTLALLCKDLSLILAFDSRDRLLQWNSKISLTLGQERQYLVQMVQVPVKSRICLGPCRMHVRDHRFCLTSGTPPKLLGAWACIDLRRYGEVKGRFVWEGGNKSCRGAGVHVALSDAPIDITHAIDLASRGALTSNNRRGPGFQGASSGTIQRDAAAWLRDVAAIDICQFSEAGDAASIVASEAGSLFFPRQTNGSYTVGGSSSSSGSLVGDEPGWWANTWANGRGSMWEVAPSPLPDNCLYDSPRQFPHSVTSLAVSHSLPAVPTLCRHNLRHSSPHNPLARGHYQQQMCMTSNPMDNYDVPKSHFQYYDVPRRFSHQESGTSHVTMNSQVTCLQQNGQCGRMFCWAGSFACSHDNCSNLELPDRVKVDGEGRMPVLDANTGVMLRGQPLSGLVFKEDSCRCKHSPLCSLNRDEPAPPVYAVVDKSRKDVKRRAPTPPPSPECPEDQTPTNPHPNYENIFNLHFSLRGKDECSFSPESGHCSACSGNVPVQEREPHRDCNLATENNISEGNEVDASNKCHGAEGYLLMGPGPPPESDQPLSHYLCMETSTTPLVIKENVPQSLFCRPGRSLSLARGYHPSLVPLRRSNSADSVLQEPIASAHFETPDLTPCSTPMMSPPNSPFRMSSPRSDSSRSGRGRPRTRPQGVQCQNHNNKVYFPNCWQKNHSASKSAVNSSAFLSSSSQDEQTKQKFDGSPLYSHTDRVGFKSSALNPLVTSCNTVTTASDSLSCHTTPILRRSSSVPGKSANRDSASSSDSGVCESPRPSERVLLSYCLHNSLPRGPRHKQQQQQQQQQQQLNSGVRFHLKPGLPNNCCRDVGLGLTVDAKSSSSGTSDISDYLDTLSISSHSSSDHERLAKARGPSVTTLRPRSGREYSRLDRLTLDQGGLLAPVGELNFSSDKK